MKKIFSIILTLVVTLSFSFVEANKAPDENKFFLTLLFILLCLGFAYMVIQLTKKPAEDNIQEETNEEGIPRKFGGDGGKAVARGGGLVVLFLLLPSLASARDMNYQPYLDFLVLFIEIGILVGITVSIFGIAYFSQPRFANLWTEWSPWHKATWRPFLVTLWLYRVLEPLLFARTWRNLLLKIISFTKSIPSFVKAVHNVYCDIIVSIATADRKSVV